ncbi:MAG TPA: tRNA (adenosine(37)-N6)-dimethylallyltransferase MiaA [Bryobacteraceae bacterium]|nr:tRNA (adenosine(37)-N6)-dimethylallyltransferase MiaA [Bryobacteraceae bacterium]
MTISADLKPLLIVLGPTGAGKSDLALHLARQRNGEIVNYDSLQVYRGFDIGTAKTPVSERQGIPHHLIDVVSPGEHFTAGDFARLARVALRQIAARGRIPVLVGGTGLYLRALLVGLSQGPARDPAIRERLERRAQKRPLSLHRILSRLDPTAASRIHSNDKKKIIRALEVRLLQGRPITDLFLKGRDPLTGFRPIKIGLNPSRESLNQRLDARTLHIFETGLVEEARSLLANGVPANAKPFESIGYKQALLVLDGRLTTEQAIQSTQLETRQYAKRQVTWFRKEDGVQWLQGYGDDPAIQARALTLIETD